MSLTIGSAFDDPFFHTGLARLPGFEFDTLGLPSLRSQRALVRMPLKVTENDTNFKVLAEMPGINNKSDIDLKVEQGVLSITAEKKQEKKSDTETCHMEEFQYGTHQRRIRLPDYVDATSPTATFRDGVLEVVLDKFPQRKEQPINIPIQN